VLLAEFPDLPTRKVFVPRYGLTLTPWDNWAGNTNPDWWRSYNNVKHERNTHFQEATLQNALNALGALLILTYIYYNRSIGAAVPLGISPKETTQHLVPESTLIRLPQEYYYDTLAI
jgi:hypothetical protein